MPGYSLRHRKWGLPHTVAIIIIALIIGVGIGAALGLSAYHDDIQAVSASQKAQVFTVNEGDSVGLIASNLQSDGLIQSSWAFQLYLHFKGLTDKVQAGTYSFAPDEDIGTIAGVLTNGRVSSQLVTILPGQRIDQLRSYLINLGFSPTEVDAALNNIAQYSDIPIMSILPTSTNTLEGLLWPDSWYKDADTVPSDIIRESLQEMGQHLTPTIDAALASENLTPYQGITLASVVIQEVNKPTDQAQAAQVFLSRLKLGMKLGSDVTARYGSIIAGQIPNLTYDSPYNTLLNTGLPPTPISTINQSSLNAVAHPAATNYLYFVTGDNGTTYFSNTYAEQQANTAQYCHKLCSQ